MLILLTMNIKSSFKNTKNYKLHIFHILLYAKTNLHLFTLRQDTYNTINNDELDVPQ